MNYYEIIEITINFSEQELKTAYRKKAFEFHPDQNNGCEKAAAKFRKIQTAYETLSNQEQRFKYDLENGISPQTQNSTTPADIIGGLEKTFADIFGVNKKTGKPFSFKNKF